MPLHQQQQQQPQQDQPTSSRDSRRPRVRLVCAAGLHIIELLLQGAVLLVVTLLVKQSHVFPIAILTILSPLWVFVFMSHTVEAWREPGIACAWKAVRAVILGFIRWAHLRHIWMVYQFRCSMSVDSTGSFMADLPESAEQLRQPLLNVGPGTQHQRLQQQQLHQQWTPFFAASPSGKLLRPSYLHGKVSRTALAAFPFAIFSLYSLCVLDICHLIETLDPFVCVCHAPRHHVSSQIWCYRGVFACTCFVSMKSIAVCTLDVDYCVSDWVYKQVEGSFRYAWLHLTRRLLEVASSLILLVLASVQILEFFDDERIIGPLCLFVPIILLWMCNTIILFCESPAGEPKKTWWSPIFMGLVAIVVVPTMFVDSPVYREAAKRANRRLWEMKCWFFVVLLVAAIVPNAELSWVEPDHWRSCLTVRNICLLLVFATLLITYLLVTAVSRTCFGKPMEQHDSAELRVRLNSDAGRPSNMQQVLAPVSLSSFLLQVAGRSGSSFGEGDEGDVFVIESKLGSGAFGVVVKVRLALSTSSNRYALKLQNMCDHHKEATILASINHYNHPFLVRLVSFFCVPENKVFQYEDGSEVDGPRGPTFRTGIMMELCEAGTLEKLLEEKWVKQDDALSGENLRLDHSELTAHLQRLHLWRQLGAELVNVFAFLQSKKPPVVYRDLKPDNVLLRQGKKEDLHICLTDFGLAKRPTFDNPLESVVGNPYLRAPEVSQDVRGPYTPKVDNWAVGHMLLIMMWCTYIDYPVTYGQTIKIPVKPDRNLWYKDDPDPRVPALAVKLIDALTKEDPEERGTMQEASQADFFTKQFEHMGEVFEPVDMQELLKDAER